MKYLILLSLLAPFSGYGQKPNSPEIKSFLISNPRQNIVYVGIDNTLDFVVSTYPCQSFKLEATNGEIKKTDRPCLYTINPDKKGDCDIRVVSRKSGKAIGNYKFVAYDLPLPEVKITGKGEGEISKNFMKAQLGLLAELNGFDIQVRYVIDKFSIIIIRGDEAIFIKENTGALFNSEIKNALNSIQVGDRIIFAGINFKGPNGSMGLLKPSEFVITD
jgi:hypothetical protein